MDSIDSVLDPIMHIPASGPLLKLIRIGWDLIYDLDFMVALLDFLQIVYKGSVMAHLSNVQEVSVIEFMLVFPFPVDGQKRQTAGDFLRCFVFFRRFQSRFSQGQHSISISLNNKSINLIISKYMFFIYIYLFKFN